MKNSTLLMLVQGKGLVLWLLPLFWFAASPQDPPSDPCQADPNACMDLSADPNQALGAQDGGVSARVPVCSPDNFCWQNPLPQGNPLHAVFGVDANNIWAVGDGGTRPLTSTTQRLGNPLSGVALLFGLDSGEPGFGKTVIRVPFQRLFKTQKCVGHVLGLVVTDSDVAKPDRVFAEHIHGNLVIPQRLSRSFER